ncbi:50S ribosomal protein L25 [Paenibacillus dakarensis]|uniref:50S ribosomal protein L25 n=1 Tax=Paenibacillus dakarensis TaxID=1527293 RepID=UPI0006D55076|nr:50S ribosomal protein L25 [Paenibacillus dakarensis]
MTSKGNNVQLNAEIRNEFTRASRRNIRQNGGVPAVVYGTDSESIPVSVNLKETAKLFHTGRSEVFNLNIEGSDSIPVLIKDIQQRAGKVEHIDFLHISMNKAVRVRIPLEVQGTAKGTKAGGVLQLQETELEIEGLPGDLPASIEVDVSDLDVGDKITVADIKIPSGITLHASEEEVLASVIAPRSVEADGGESESADEEPVEEVTDTESSEQ